MWPGDCDEENGQLAQSALSNDLPQRVFWVRNIALEQDPDVLDTWFSSALWPHSTLGWPEQTPELAYYYPTSVLVTSRDIITLWVARMVMTGLYNIGKVPFHHVYIHPKILDGFGETMSKTQGQRHRSARHHRALRRRRPALPHGRIRPPRTQDSRMPVANVCPHCDTLVPVKQEHMYMRTRKVTCPNCKKPFRPGGPWPAPDPELPTAKQASERFEMGRNFANKLWNAARFLLLNLEGYTPAAMPPEELPIEDRWILSRLATTDGGGDGASGKLSLQRSGAGDLRLHLVGVLRLVRGDEQGPAARRRRRGPLVQRVLVGVLDAHPAAGAADHAVRGRIDLAGASRSGVRARPAEPEPRRESVVIAPWPAFPKRGRTPRWKRAWAACRNWCAWCARCATATRSTRERRWM